MRCDPRTVGGGGTVAGDTRAGSRTDINPQRFSASAVEAAMPSKKTTHPAPTAPAGQNRLTRFLRDPANKRLSTAEFVERGVLCVSEAEIRALQAELGQVRQKIDQIPDSQRLQSRLHLLAQYVEESRNGTVHATDTCREAAFALAYFAHGSDRIPDETPEYGLLDDALVVEAVLERNSAALREHWQRANRPWPEPA